MFPVFLNIKIFSFSEICILAVPSDEGSPCQQEWSPCSMKGSLLLGSFSIQSVSEYQRESMLYYKKTTTKKRKPHKWCFRKPVEA
jgi:hypothetical protein